AGRLAQIREQGIGDRTPRDTRPHLDAAHGQTRAPETSDMLEIAGGVACLALDDPYLVVHGAARTAAADDVAPRGLVAGSRDQITSSPVRARRSEKRRIGVRGGAHTGLRGGLFSGRREAGGVEARAAATPPRPLLSQDAAKT